MMLKPQDIVLVLKLLSRENDNWSQGSLSQELVMSASEVNAGLKRLAFARIIEKHEDNRRWKVIKPALKEFLFHGIQYVFPAEKGAPAIGTPTANAASPLDKLVSGEDAIPVWPDKNGKVKGYAFIPLYTSVPLAAQKDEELYEWLVLVDALRDTDNLERNIAEVSLSEKLSGRSHKPKALKNKPQSKDDQQLDLLSL